MKKFSVKVLLLMLLTIIAVSSQALCKESKSKLIVRNLNDEFTCLSICSENDQVCFSQHQSCQINSHPTPTTTVVLSKEREPADVLGYIGALLLLGLLCGILGSDPDDCNGCPR